MSKVKIVKSTEEYNAVIAGSGLGMSLTLIGKRFQNG